MSNYDYGKKMLKRQSKLLKLNKIYSNVENTLANTSLKIPEKNVCTSKDDPIDGKNFEDIIMIESFSPGGATIVHSYEEDLINLSKEEKLQFSKQFFKEVFSEEVNGIAKHVMGVIHNGARYLPDFLEFLYDIYPLMIIKSQVMGKTEVETMNISSFYEEVMRTYHAGTYQSGGLTSISLVGAKSEECGGYFSDLLDLLELHPCIGSVMPWGTLSNRSGWPRNLSNDGPILWSRPGEQVVPTDLMSRKTTANRKSKNELKKLAFVVRNSDSRETLVEDRTKAHADHVGEGLQKVSTAAVGVLKAVHCGQKSFQNRVVKDAILFDAANFDYLVSRLKLDLHEPPMTQCIKWIEDGKLNLLAREGVKYAKYQLRDNDVYFIPRNVVHQFKTITAVTSVAWHVRLSQYYTTFEKQIDIPKPVDSVPITVPSRTTVVDANNVDTTLKKASIKPQIKKQTKNKFKAKQTQAVEPESKVPSQLPSDKRDDQTKNKKPRKRKLDGFEVVEFQLSDMRFKTRVIIPKYPVS